MRFSHKLIYEKECQRINNKLWRNFINQSVFASGDFLLWNCKKSLHLKVIGKLMSSVWLNYHGIKVK